MRRKIIAACMLVACISMISCDDTTNTIGDSLIDNGDKLSITADTFSVASETMVAGRVIARSSTGYLGRMVDPETMTTVTGNLMSQFHVLSNYELPAKDSIMSRDANNEIIADSCDIRLYYSTYYGDSLSQMKMTAYELSKPVKEGESYYSDFDPEAQGYIRPAAQGGIAEKRSFTLTDYTEADSIRNRRNYNRNIIVRLNKQYKDKNGVTYNNYGTYLLRKYQQDPSAFRNPYRFLHEICPGFYFKVDGGSGSMAHIQLAQLNIYFKNKQNGKVSEISTNFVSTEEVLQLTNFSNDNTKLQQLANESGHTYLKTPAGLFTKLTLPMSDIMAGHTNDSINTAKVVLHRINNSSISDYQFGIPHNVVMVPADSLQSFFANNRLPDNKTSFMATYNSKTNAYEFNNISGIVNLFSRNRTMPAWGKVVVVPVELQSVTQGTGSSKKTVITKVSNDMGLSSTKLLGNTSTGKNIQISIIYGKFNGR